MCFKANSILSVSPLHRNAKDIYFCYAVSSIMDANALGFVITKAHVPTLFWQLGFIQCGIIADHLVILQHQLKSKYLTGKDQKHAYLQE